MAKELETKETVKEVKEPKAKPVIGEVTNVDSKETHVGTEIVRLVTFVVGGTFKPGERYEMIKKG